MADSTVARDRALAEGTCVDIDASWTLWTLVERAALQRPDAIAVDDDEGALRYGELLEQSEVLARRLVAAGVRRGDRVGLCAGRSRRMVVAMLAILRTGAAYVPMDPRFPKERLRFYAEDAGLAALACDQANEHLLGPMDVPSIRFDVDDTEVPEGPSMEGPQPEDPAYVLYTSGSTGKPKGVLVPHRAIVNFIVGMAHELPMKTDDVMLAITTLSFDISLLEVFLPLHAGARVSVADDDVAQGGPLLLRALEERNVTWLQGTPATWRMLLGSGWNGDPALTALVGGEALHPELAAQIRSRVGTLVNVYGPTETTVWSTFFHVPAGGSPVRIGTPLPNQSVYVLGEEGQLLEKGAEGELYIGGTGVTLGYHERPDLTADRFLPDPFQEGGTMYRTGDLVRMLPDGDLEYIGRADFQVKVRGFRIELGEIEAQLSSHPGVQAAAVVAREDRPGDVRLVAYWVAAADRPTEGALITHLRSTLPDYMLPQRLVELEEMPLTPNLKIDRKALPAPDRQRPALEIPFVAPRTTEERAVAAIWSDLLGIDGIGLDDNFFELGGTSLLAVAAVEKMARAGVVEATITDFFQHPTIRALTTLDIDHDDTHLRVLLERRGAAAPREREPIAIVGMSCRFPGAGDPETFWRNLVEGVETTSFLSREELDPSLPRELVEDPRYVPARGIIPEAENFDAAFFRIPPLEADVIDPQQRVFLELAWEAMEDAGMVPGTRGQAVGVYAGLGNSTYLTKCVLPRQDVFERLGEFQVSVANEADYLATRVAHRLDLHGPAVTIQTACSTSLVAVGEAMLALRAGVCDVAIAGGVTVTAPIRSGHLYIEGGMLSADGHCRPFDASSSGTVFSDGAGAVVLKRLSEALADGDHVYAVLLGVGMNNDGAEKASFTAPNVRGQAEAVIAAQASAGVPARTISYVEAHGTGTPLGDPIEVEALSRAFRLQTEDRGFCSIGSVKSNFGHLVAAAGVAGLMKTALALEREELPPTLHFDRPNPNIAFEDSPFVVQSRRTEWKRGSTPRRAGVTSLGVGGTNVHVVLEEAPAIEPSGPSRPRQLLLLSGRTETAVAAASERLAAHLEAHPDLPLADVAYTLAIGRKHFRHRRAIVADSTEEAVRLLRGSASAAAGKASGHTPPVSFLFPGQGAQSVRMGQALYRDDPTFRAVVDRCADILLPQLGRDLRDVLYPGGETDAAQEILRQTAFTQPALFVVEYALAQMWMGLGIRPDTMVGHSVGEFVAACLAGVFSLEDALLLVATRGRMMQGLPPGKMLSVRAPAAEVEARLPEGTSIASINAPKLCVVAGRSESIDELQAALEREEIPCRALQTSHAFHSPMMEPVVEPFEEMVRSIELRAPQIPIVSTVTGKLLTEAEATDPGYWARHLRAPVLFSHAIRTLAEDPARVLLEVGPRATLATLARQKLGNGRTIASTLREPEGDEAWSSFLAAAGQLHCAGASVDFHSLHAGERRLRVPLPTYPFERKRHWLGQSTAPVVQLSIGEGEVKNVDSERALRLVAELQEIFAETSGLEPDELAPDAHFLELGFDSLMLTQIALAVSRSYKVKVTFRQLMEELATFQTLARHLDAVLPAEVVEPAATVEAAAPAGPVEAPPAPAAASPAAVQAQVASPAAALPAAVVAPALPVPAVPQASLVAPPPTLVGTSPAMGGPLQSVIQQQLQLMAQQLAVLGGAGPMPALPLPTNEAQGETSPPQVLPVQENRANGVSTNGVAKNGVTKNGGNGVQTPGAQAVAQQKAPAPEPQEETGPVRYDPKKAFGAIARIHTNREGGLDSRQQEALETFIRNYNARTAGSKAATQAARQRMADPRVVNGFRPLVKELVYPIVVTRSEGSRLWDVDGNEYIDILNGFGAIYFGHRPDFVTAAVARQLEDGYELGPQTPLAMEVAELFCEITSQDRAAFCNTGSEAVMGAIRMARTITGRNTIAVFSGSYHGIFDEVIVRAGRQHRARPAAPGILPEAVDNVIVLDYGAPESLAILRERADELAAVLVEPVQSRHPDVQPRAFLHEVRAITEKSETALIFDEVITGFRMGPGGAQDFYGVRADIATYGKVVGGGMPIGVIAGKRRFMDALDGGHWQFGDDSIPTVGVTYFAGTFVRHPLAMAAARAVLLHVREQGPELQQRVNERTARLVKRLLTFFDSVGAPITIKTFASLWKVVFTEEQPHGDLLFYHLRHRGMHVYDGFPCYLTTAHTDEDVDRIFEAFRDSVLDLQAEGFLPRKAPRDPITFDASQPPVPGARLGRDPDGQPAWYVPDEIQPGRFVKFVHA